MQPHPGQALHSLTNDLSGNVNTAVYYLLRRNYRHTARD